MLFGKKNDSFEKKQVLEINYLKENRVLQEIIKVSYETKDLVTASNKIVQIICNSYNINYCSLFLVMEGRFKIAGSNVPFEMFDRLENFALAIYKEKCEGKEADAYVLKSEQPMNYDTGWERGIKYLMFSPLVNNGLIGSILIENTSLTITQSEMEFFELVVENIALVLQNLLYFRKIVDAANKDGLTNIFNRHYMNMHLNSVINSASQNQKIFSLALFDIDFFKKFNDTYGHLHGDKVLKEVSHYIEKEIRSCDCVYRYGGEEFIIYFADANIDTVYMFLEKLRIGIENLNITTDKNEITRVTISMGVAEFPRCDNSLQGLIEKADNAMYYSKEHGRNRVTKYTDIPINNPNESSNMHNANTIQNMQMQNQTQTQN